MSLVHYNLHTCKKKLSEIDYTSNVKNRKKHCGHSKREKIHAIKIKQEQFKPHCMCISQIAVSNIIVCSLHTLKYILNKSEYINIKQVQLDKI